MPRRLAALGVLGLLAVVLLSFLASPGRAPAALAVASGAPGDEPAAVPSELAFLPLGSAMPWASGPDGGASPLPGSGGGATGSGTGPIALGAFIPGAASDPTKLDAYARLVGAMPRIVMWYQAWVGPWNGFSPRIADAIRARGAMPMVSWEPTAGALDDPAWTLRTISDGAHDAYLRAWLAAAARWGHELYVRPMYEMNGWWAPWCASVNGNTPGDFVAAWRHIVGLGRSLGATNIRWVWSPNVDNKHEAVPLPGLYPGDAWVDWVALDGFNRGRAWVSVQQIFTTTIATLRTITTKPLMIGETGSGEAGGDKATWIRDGFANIPRDLPDVRAVIWFDEHETRIAVDWRVDSSPAALAAFRAVATSKAFSGELP